jgi:hypothetical protein
MPTLKPEEEQSGPPITAPDSPAGPPGGYPQFGPPSNLTGFGDVGGLKGRARFDSLMQSNLHMFGSGYWGHDFNTWIMSQKEDPTDLEFNALLAWAKRNAKLVEERGLQRQAGETGPVTKISPPENPMGGLQTGVQAPIGPSGVPPEPPPPPTEKSFKGTVDDPEEEKRLQGAPRREYMADQKTRFKGSTDDLEFLLGQGELSPGEQQYISTNGTTLNGPKEEYAKKSGAFVYMGAEAGASGATHDVYVYYKDAEAGIFTIPADQMKTYQKRTDLDTTGYPQDELQGEWNKAVGEAQQYAKAGIKISVRELFDRRIARVEAQLRASRGGGGGGGGSSFVGENPAEVAAIDYYRAMMQVLGDISGMPNPGGAG